MLGVWARAISSFYYLSFYIGAIFLDLKNLSLMLNALRLNLLSLMLLVEQEDPRFISLLTKVFCRFLDIEVAICGNNYLKAARRSCERIRQLVNSNIIRSAKGKGSTTREQKYEAK